MNFFWHLILCPFKFFPTVIFERFLKCVFPNDKPDIENLSNSSDSHSPNTARQSVPSYPNIHSSLITSSLSLSFSSYGCQPGNKSEFLASQNLTEEEFQEHPTINWDAILWVRRPLELWVVQVILAMVSLTEALLLAYLGYKVRHPSLLQINSVFITRYSTAAWARLLFYWLAHRRVLWFIWSKYFSFLSFSQNN